MTAKKTNKDLESRLTEKRNTESRLQEVRQELSQPHLSESALSALGVKCGDLLTRIQSYKAKGESLDARQRGELKQFQDEHQEVVDQSKQARSERDQLIREKEALENQLANYDYLCSEEELREHLSRLQTVQAEVTELKTAIQHQEEVISEARDNAPDLGSIKSRHQGALADMVLGKGDQKHLDKAEKDLADAGAAKQSGAALIKQAEAAIAGLRKRLIDAEGRAVARQGDVQEASFHYLIHRAKLINDEYTGLVEELAKRYTQLQAISTILHKTSGGTYPGKVVAHHEHRLFIPSFTIGSPGSIAPAPTLNSDSIDLEGAVQEELARIRTMGVMLG